jgi:hypothetical protein
MTQRVLVAPAGSRFSSEAGSEEGWVADIVTRVADIDSDLWFACVAEETGGRFSSTVHPVAVGRWRTEELSGCCCPCAWTGRQGFTYPAGQMATPVSTCSTTHCSSLWGAPSASWPCGRHGLPVVVGPLQTPLEWIGPDEGGGQLAAPPERLRRSASTGAALVWPLAKGRPGTRLGHEARRAVRWRRRAGAATCSRRDGVGVAGAQRRPRPGAALLGQRGVVQVNQLPVWVAGTKPAASGFAGFRGTAGAHTTRPVAMADQGGE